MIPFNKPFLTGKETIYIEQAVQSGKISGNGIFTQKCQQFFQDKYGFKKCLLTTSCTDALEMTAMLINCVPGDEIIVPSYTFVSSALAFIRQGAKIIFADSMSDHPNIDCNTIETLITSKTKAIVVVHYAGTAVDMDKIMELANRYNLIVIEDAAQAVDSFYKGKALGSIGHLAAFSFHETKNIISGEGGMLAVNDNRFMERAEIIWEKGTNRASFFRGEINKYGWVDTGSSFLPSEVIAAFLYAQLENLEVIQQRRKEIWNVYYEKLSDLQLKDKLKLPNIPDYASNNAHMFYILCKSFEERSQLIQFLKKQNIHAVFHYISLHKSDYYTKENSVPELPCSDKYTDCLLRLPFYYELKDEQQQTIIRSIKDFYNYA
ncbi:MAG TPA: dTDP-4-amino-4,6-dideoxygalactose transaminase [Flavobacterium sp.]|uniref:dTDP-4-amino-4,6-dideoxygalactose transaminase n=1 Tax=Flavobacterium sp. TaxID=239 RepID=UPI002DBEDAB3|nr:dTDP-4-amino-4,6-dideoxygalactose transaminase [Flavobacterium sp.]HEU4790026.1 dTDP-4-amino-4,6-dideoxygalactose transaminase [Flavobacterium sp.]